MNQPEEEVSSEEEVSLTPAGNRLPFSVAELRALDGFLPGASGRLVELCLRDMEQRSEIAALQSRGRERREWAKVFFLYFLGILGFIITALNHDAVGGVVLGTSLASVAAVIITGRRKDG